MQRAGLPPQYCKSWVETLNAAGYSVCGIDQQGCGFSEGLECYVERFHFYVDDVLQFARWERSSSCPQIFFLGVTPPPSTQVNAYKHLLPEAMACKGSCCS